MPLLKSLSSALVQIVLVVATGVVEEGAESSGNLSVTSDLTLLLYPPPGIIVISSLADRKELIIKLLSK